MNYEDVERLLIDKRGNERESKKIGNNTYAERRDESIIAIRLHSTDVVTFRPGERELNAGEWFTMTTKDRINGYAGFRVHSERGRWIVTLKAPSYGDIPSPEWSNDDESRAAWREYRRKVREATVTVPFFNGIRISDSGEVLNPRPRDVEEAEEKERKKLKRDISKYVKLCMETFKAGMPLPSGDDCWYCLMFEPAGQSDNYHLIEHMREGYVVPSLLFNAVKERGYRMPSFILGATENGMGGRNGFSHGVSHALRRYLTARLVPSETRGVTNTSGFAVR
jgi:hypothetical protein